MSKPLPKFICAAFLCSMLAFAPSSHADTVYCTNCSNTAIQNLEHAIATSQLAELKTAYDQYVQQTAHQLTLVSQTLQQYQNMVQNTLTLPASVISEINAELSKLSQITSALNTLRNDIVGMGTVFDSLYKTQDELDKLASLPNALSSGKRVTYQGYWDTWANRVDESTRATFQLTGKQLNDLVNSGETETYINKLLTTPEGQQQALMAGNQLAALQIQESRQLRELIATKFQSDIASQQKREKEAQYSQMEKRRHYNFEGLNLTPKDDPSF